MYMTKYISKLFRVQALLLPLLLYACVNYDDVTDSLTVQIQLVAPEAFNTSEGLDGRDVNLTINGQTTTVKTDANGLATFKGIVPDVYNISASWKITGAEYTALTGIVIAENRRCTVSGSLAGQMLQEGQNRLTLPLHVNIDPDVIISKIASAGCKDENNRTYMAGKYLELYNNADEAIDVAGLYIGLLDSDNPQPYTLENLQEVYNGEYVLIKQIFRIPASKPFLVQPGGTVLLTNSAIDHRDVSPLESDLRDADFEAKDVSGSYQNNPAVPALENAFSRTSGSSIMNLVQGGPCGVVLFRTDEDVTTFPRTYAYGKTSGNQWLLLPVRLIIDGVDYLKKWNDGVRIGTKRLPTIIDASYANINATAGWTGEVVYRRTEGHAADGHALLMDTNNSLNDFTVSTTIKPREYDN